MIYIIYHWSFNYHHNSADFKLKKFKDNSELFSSKDLKAYL